MPPSTAALEAKIGGLCREDLEKAYRDIAGELGPSFQGVPICNAVSPSQSVMMPLAASFCCRAPRTGPHAYHSFYTGRGARISGHTREGAKGNSHPPPPP